MVKREQFDVISRVQDSRPPNHRKAQVALGIVLAMVLAIALAPVDSAVIALTAAGLMVLSRCLPGRLARAAIDYPMLLVIGAAIGIGRAMEHTGAAENIAEQLLALAEPYGPLAILSCVYMLAVVFGNLISNNSAAVWSSPLLLPQVSRCNWPQNRLRRRSSWARVQRSSPRCRTPQTSWSTVPAATTSWTTPESASRLSSLRGLMMVILIPIFFPFQ